MLNEYKRIIEEYPEYITKEQFRLICKISKRTALYYLRSGLLPAIDSGKKTRQYKIATADVITLIEDRKENPGKYLPPDGWYKNNDPNWEYAPKQPTYKLMVLEHDDITRTRLENHISEYEDLLRVEQVAEITGYADSTVLKWCKAKKLFKFKVQQTHLIPKTSLIDFMLSKHFDGIKLSIQDYDSFSENFYQD